MEDLQDYSVSQLKEELCGWSLSIKGNNNILHERLEVVICAEISGPLK